MTDNCNPLILAGIKDPEKIKYAFELIIQLSLKLLDADEGSLLIYRKAENDLQFVSTVGSADGKSLAGQCVPLGQGITGMAAVTGEIQTASRASGGDFFRVENDGMPNSVIAAPILLDEELIGVITAVSFRQDKMFTSEDCRNFDLLSRLGAIVISDSQTLENYSKDTISSLTKQEELEMQAAQQAVALIRSNRNCGEKIVQILSLLGGLK